MICGEKLQYHEKALDLTCNYCRKADSGNIVCPKGHYVCDPCHNRNAMQVIEGIMLTTDSTSPAAIAELAFTFPGLPMLGCPHAYIAGGALMASLKNSGVTLVSQGGAAVGNEEIREVFRRTRKQAYGGYCGLTGVCGIAPALGACVSILTGSKCGTDEAQRLTMEAVTRVTRAITSLTGPSCCKAYSRISLTVMLDFLKENLGIKLPREAVPVCRYTNKHPHGCRENKCPYYSK